MIVESMILCALFARLDLETVRLPVLAYCTDPECAICRAGNARTAWPPGVGSDPAKPGLAVTPDSGIPLGARVAVPGYGWVTADDRSTIETPAAELRTGRGPGAHARARDWGNQTLTLYYRRPQ